MRIGQWPQQGGLRSSAQSGYRTGCLDGVVEQTGCRQKELLPHDVTRTAKRRDKYTPMVVGRLREVDFIAHRGKCQNEHHLDIMLDF